VLARATSAYRARNLAEPGERGGAQRRAVQRKVVRMADFRVTPRTGAHGRRRRSMIISGTEKRITAIQNGVTRCWTSAAARGSIHKFTMFGPARHGARHDDDAPIEREAQITRADTCGISEFCICSVGVGRIYGRDTPRRHHDRPGQRSRARTDMARKMVCEWGMSDSMGTMTLGKKERDLIGREIAQHQDYSRGHGAQDRPRG